MKTIMEKLKESGAQLDFHESDLYVLKTHETERILKDYQFLANVTTFISQIDNQTWFDIPFANDKFWQDKKAGE